MVHRTAFLFVALLLVATPARAQTDGEAAAAVQRAAETLLASRFPEAADRFDVRVRRIGGTVDPARPLRLEIRPNGVPEGLTRVRVHPREGSGARSGTGWALLHVAHFDSVLTLRSRIRSGASVTPAHVEGAWTEVTDMRGDPLRTADFRAKLADGALIATRMLRPGRVLRQNDVRPPYAVDTGAAVEMHYTRNRLSFRLACRAREPGFSGDVIRVYCEDTRTTYRVQLTDADTARWIETL